MRRLTYKLNEQEQEEHKTKYLKFEYFPIPDYCIEKGNYGRITSDMLYNKLGKLEDLEEEIGCPLDVVFKALKDGIYDEYRNLYKADEFYLNYNWVLSNPNDKYLTFNVENTYFEFKLKDYKETWWLKADRSE